MGAYLIIQMTNKHIVCGLRASKLVLKVGGGDSPSAKGLIPLFSHSAHLHENKRV